MPTEYKPVTLTENNKMSKCPTPKSCAADEICISHCFKRKYRWPLKPPHWTDRDQRQLVLLDKACKKHDLQDIEDIIINYFEDQPADIYFVAQTLMFDKYQMEVP